MHNLTIIESTSGARAIKAASMAIIGLVATASAPVGAETAALNAAFPIGQLTLVTNVDAALAAAGTGGTLKNSLKAISDHCTPIIVVSRVAVGEDDDETEENAIAGLRLLLTAKSVVGERPRIIGAPGLDTLAVATELATVAKKLRGFGYAQAIGADDAARKLYRIGFSARELMLIGRNTNGISGDAIARALGKRAETDEKVGWHKTISNLPLSGVVSIDQPCEFDLLDSSTEAGSLNASEITAVINENGWRFWGNRTTAGEDQPEFAFESAVRTSYALQDVIAEAFQPFFDQPMTVALIKDTLETVNAAFRDLTARGMIMGAKAFFDADTNSSAQLAAGRPTFRIQFTPVAPLEDPTVNLVITDFYYAGFADQLT